MLRDGQAQRHQRIVQTGTGLRRSHRRNAISLASTIFQLCPVVLTPAPAARQTQAEACEVLNPRTTVMNANVASAVFIPNLPDRFLHTAYPQGSNKAKGARADRSAQAKARVHQVEMLAR